MDANSFPNIYIYICWGYMGLMDKKMKTTILGLYNLLYSAIAPSAAIGAIIPARTALRVCLQYYLDPPM